MINNKFNFTIKKLESLVAPIDKQKVQFGDADTKYLFLRIQKSGYKSYIYFRKLDGKLFDHQIGAFDEISLSTARLEAQKITNNISAGKNPFEKDLTPTLSEALELYLQNKNLRNSSKIAIKSTFCKRIPDQFWSRKINTIHFAEWRKLVDTIDEHHAYNNFISALKAIYNKMFLDGLLQNKFHELERLRKQSTQKRERFLEPSEIKKFFEEIVNEEHNLAMYWLLLIFTGVRKDNLLKIQISEINFDKKIWTIPVEKSKTRKVQTITLSNIAITLLKHMISNTHDDYLFFNKKGMSEARVYYRWQCFCQRCGFKNLHMHDFRHTFATYLVNSGVSSAIVQKSLNHANLDTTFKYVHFLDDPLKIAVAQGTNLMLEYAGIDNNIADNVIEINKLKKTG